MAKPPIRQGETEREYDQRMALNFPDRYPLPAGSTADLMIGFRRFDGLTFAEAFHNCIWVRALFAALALALGLALGFGSAMAGR
jgi:hypothetical protein